jgi:histone acetyltransferase (RNA polymerase elongator complex component)
MGTAGTATSIGRPLIIPLFIPHGGCPHQCVFCNQQVITGEAARIPSSAQIRREVSRFLRYARQRPSFTQISFYGGSFLGLEKQTILELLAAAHPFVENQSVDSLRFSTRPDTISPETLDWIAPFPISTVELGVQSMNDPVLEAVGRGHTAADTVTAAARLKKRGYRLGLQMMVGLPADDTPGAMRTARRMADLKPDFVRIYPTLVLTGSQLARLYRNGGYRPLPLETCIDLVKQLFLYFRSKQIPVVRMGLQASDGLADAGTLLAGPYHPAFGHLVHGEIALDAIESALKESAPPGRITITAHPAMVSRVQGLNKRNLHRLQQRHRPQAVTIAQDENLPRHRLLVGDRPITLP